MKKHEWISWIQQHHPILAGEVLQSLVLFSHQGLLLQNMFFFFFFAGDRILLLKSSDLPNFAGAG